MTPEREAADRLMDWALDEVEGRGLGPPLGYFGDPGSPDRPRARALARWWWSAAVVLLGLGVWIGVRGGYASPERRGQAVQEPEVFYVSTLRELRAVPTDARRVSISLPPEHLPELGRLEQVRELRLYHEGYGDEHLQHLASLPSLRRLEIVRTDRVQGEGLRYLETLPNLSELDLSGLPIDGEGLALIGRLKSLRVLNLSLCLDFPGPALAGLTDLPLEVLHLRSCGQLTAEDVALLGELDTLRHLDLDSRFAGGIVGVDEEALWALAGLPDLHTLDIDFCRVVTDEGLRALGTLRGLRRLEVAATSVTPAGLQNLPRTIKALNIEGNGGMGKGLVDALLAFPELESLAVGGCPGLDSEGLVRLLEHSRLVELSLSSPVRLATPELDERALVALGAHDSLRRLDLEGLDWLEGRHLRHLRELPLRELVLARCERITSLDLHEHLADMPLQHLDLRFTEIDEGWRRIAEKHWPGAVVKAPGGEAVRIPR